MIALLWAAFITCAIGLAYMLGTLRGHDEEHEGCRHADRCK